jgi:hypothetical protein
VTPCPLCGAHHRARSHWPLLVYVFVAMFCAGFLARALFVHLMS